MKRTLNCLPLLQAQLEVPYPGAAFHKLGSHNVRVSQNLGTELGENAMMGTCRPDFDESVSAQLVCSRAAEREGGGAVIRSIAAMLAGRAKRYPKRGRAA